MVFRFLGPRGPSIGGTTNGGSPPQRHPLGPTARERQLENELRVLRSERDALVRAEEEARSNLGAIQDDALASEIDRRSRATRDREMAQRGERMIARAKRIVAERGGRNITPAVIVDLVRAFTGLEKPTGWIAEFMAESAERSSSQRSPEMVTATAQMVLDSAAKARGDRNSIDLRTGRPKPCRRLSPGSIRPRGTL
jgi:hypothetical protein